MKNLLYKKLRKAMANRIQHNSKQIALGLVSLAFGATSLLTQTPVHAQSAGYNWVLSKGTTANGGGGKLAILIPNTKSVLGRLECIDNQGNGTYTVFTLAANVGKLKPRTPAKVTITTTQGKHDFSGLVVDPATGGGIQGITFSIANGHAVWPEIITAKHFDYQVQGFAGSRLVLTAAKGKIGHFTSSCGFSPKVARKLQIPGAARILAPAVAASGNQFRAIAVYLGKIRGKRDIQFRYGYSGIKTSPAAAKKSAIAYCKRYAKKRRGKARCKVVAVVGTDQGCEIVSTTYRGKKIVRGRLCLDGYERIRQASSKKKTKKAKGRCRPRSVYVAGRGCILKRYVK